MTEFNGAKLLGEGGMSSSVIEKTFSHSRKIIFIPVSARFISEPTEWISMYAETCQQSFISLVLTICTWKCDPASPIF
jgi:hypothetical protein